jgi:hypothetical protein
MYSGRAHFITSSKKGLSEPNWVGKVISNFEKEPPRSQEDSLVLTERLPIVAHRTIRGKTIQGYPIQPIAWIEGDR